MRADMVRCVCIDGGHVKKEAGEELIRRGLVTTAMLDEAKAARSRNGESILTNLLFDKRVRNKDEITNSLAGFLKIPVISLASVQPDPRLIRRCSKEMARKYRFVPIAVSGRHVVVGMLDPMDLQKIDELSGIFGRPVQAVFIRKSDFEAHIHGLFHDAGIATGKLRVDPEAIKKGSDAALVGKVLTSAIARAVRGHASALDFLPEKDRTFIRFRFGGTMKTVHELPTELHRQMIARIREMAKIAPASGEKRQTGQCRVGIGTSRFLLHVTIIPTAGNEHAHIRIADVEALKLPVDSLGLDPAVLPAVREVLSADEGMVLVTGPPGSGKTCTLYAFMRHARKLGRKVMMIESPVEMRVEGVTQIQVDEEHGFAEAAQAVLDENADVIVIGDIRDSDAARFAFDAAGRGYLVLAGMESGRIREVFRAMKDRGVDPAQVASVLRIISAQRLLRKLCPDCKSKAKVHEEISQQWGIGEALEFYDPKGCDQCLRSGFRGRLAVHETMIVDDAMRDLMAAGTHALELEKQARYRGMLTMFEAGMNRAIEGSTSLEEVFGSLPCPDTFNLQERLHVGRVGHLRDPDAAPQDDDSLADMFRAEKEAAKEAAAEPLNHGIFMPADEPAGEEAAASETPVAEPVAEGEGASAASEQPAAPGNVEAEKATILLVDDSPTTLEYIKHILSIGGLHVETADCAEKAWKMLQQQRPDLVLTDFILPDMSGGELIERIRQTPAFDDIGTMMMTASKDEASALNSGADAFIGKPTDPDLLIARAKSIIGIYKRRMPQQAHAVSAAAPSVTSDPGGVRKIELSTLQFEKKAAGFELDTPAAAQNDDLGSIFSPRADDAD
ncbi:MAG: ATPase, T2SS/T4P/T4SS family [Mariprofundaceae bacterium]|nr:ATPase, T2SS/T4P/T4SS family [Mariprofundaceae bacterium]